MEIKINTHSDSYKGVKMKGQTRNLFLITFSLILTGCNLLTEQKILTEEPSAIPEVAASPTPTSTLLTGSRATGGALEIRYPMIFSIPN